MGKARSKNSFVEFAKEHDLDTDEAQEAFDRAMGKIAKPKRKGDVSKHLNDAENDSK